MTSGTQSAPYKSTSTRRAGKSDVPDCTYEVVQNLVSDNSNHVKGLRGSDRVHQHVPMDANEVFGV